jgi:hypothetical protein
MLSSNKKPTVFDLLLNRIVSELTKKYSFLKESLESYVALSNTYSSQYIPTITQNIEYFNTNYFSKSENFTITPLSENRGFKIEKSSSINGKISHEYMFSDDATNKYIHKLFLFYNLDILFTSYHFLFDKFKYTNDFDVRFIKTQICSILFKTISEITYATPNNTSPPYDYNLNIKLFMRTVFEKIGTYITLGISSNESVVNVINIANKTKITIEPIIRNILPQYYQNTVYNEIDNDINEKINSYLLILSYQ